MSDRQIKITGEQMRAVARYETTVSEIADFKNNSEVDVIFEQPFQITLDDVLEAVKNIEAKNPLVKELCDEWIYPLVIAESVFGITEACEAEEDDSGQKKENGPLDVLPVTEAAMFREIWFKLENIVSEYGDFRGIRTSSDRNGGLSFKEPTCSDEFDDFEEDFEEDFKSGEDDLEEDEDGEEYGFEDDEDDEEYSFEDDDDDGYGFESDDENLFADLRISDVKEFGEILAEAGLFAKNKGKTPIEMEFDDARKQAFISYFDDGSYLKKATDLEVSLCRRFTDELCAKDSVDALRLKGYACYGGNRLYACDWPASRDCMIRLFDKTGAPGYANTLGYIYYYGRCTDGVPEYEKAYEMFVISAANGLHEGMYKLADMFRHGYACRKSERTAENLYALVYEDARNQFLHGNEGAFADAAIRMGIIASQRSDRPEDQINAYRFFLEAGLAARRRAAKNDFFGYANVLINVKKSLEETKARIPEDYFQTSISLHFPAIFSAIASDGYRAEMTIKNKTRKNDLKEGENSLSSVTVKRLPKWRQALPEPIIWTVTELEHCDFVTEVEFEAVNLETSFESGADAGAETVFKYDTCEWNRAKSRIDFYYDNARVAWLSCDEFIFRKPAKTNDGGRVLKFVSVTFPASEREYDYLCDIRDVEPGDKVIVPGQNGDVAVVVRKVFTCSESELGLPVERYKRVIRKA